MDEEGSEKLETYERRKRRGPSVKKYVIKMAAEINTEGSKVWFCCNGKRYQVD